MIGHARHLGVSSTLLLCMFVISGLARASTAVQPEIENSEVPKMPLPQGEPGGETPAVAPPAIDTPKVAPPAIERPGWAFDASGLLFVTPDVTYLMPTFTTDYGWLHLEGRYNYEALQTASTWIGYNLSAGHVFTLKVTPMLGGVFGATNGIAVGCRGTVAWRWLEFYTEGESVFAFGDAPSSFIYFWSTLTASPMDWLHLGLVAQRTRVYQTELDIQRGFLLGFSIEHVGVTAYLFNPDLPTPTYVFALDVNW